MGVMATESPLLLAFSACVVVVAMIAALGNPSGKGGLRGGSSR
jgi:hypothetical protein